MANFDPTISVVLQHEGGFTDNPKDRGNWVDGVVREDMTKVQAKAAGLLKGTNFGIAAFSHPDLDIEHLTVDQAKAIYKKDWDSLNLSNLINQTIATKIFDSYVNMGHRAVKIFQRAVNILRGNNVLKVDGGFGSKTLDAINQYCMVDPVNPKKLLQTVENLMWAFYDGLITEVPRDVAFEDAWKKRAYWPDQIPIETA